MATSSLSVTQLHQSMEALASSGIIAYPTEAVYGLGCDIFCADAVSRLLALKQRSWKKGLIIVAANLQQLSPLIDQLPSTLVDKLDASWPGPTTWVIPDPKQVIPSWIRGQHNSVAIRISAHPVVQQLCSAWGAPLVSTSANYAGETPIRSELILRKRQQQGQWTTLDYIVGGSIPKQQNPSEIIDLVSGTILRPSQP